VHWNNTDHILVFGGKSERGDTLSEWLLWDAQKGWQRIEVKGDTQAPSRFGACMESVDQHSGYLFGGMSNEGVVLNDFWFWKITTGDDGSTAVELVKQTGNLHGATTLSTSVSRFGATTNMTPNGLLIVGGIGIHGLLPAEVEILLVDVGKLTSIAWDSTALCPIGLGLEFSGPRPLLIGHVSWARDSSEVLILGGGGVCFSFGTFWNNGVWMLRDIASDKQNEWLLCSESETRETSSPSAPLSESFDKTDVRKVTPIPERAITTKAAFEDVLAQSRPVVIRAADLGPCTEKWSKEYLTSTVGFDRKVVVHEARSNHMNFQKKNFSYVTKDFGTFLEEVDNGSRQYLRSISADQPSKKAANLADDFPGLNDDFQLPPQLEFARENIHSSALRISGPVTMWLHYDVRPIPSHSCFRPLTPKFFS
jgi:tRNA wybutosine-synthesizing protein 4